MSSLVRNIRKRMLKRQGYHREPPQKWVIGPNGEPKLVFVPKHKRQILDPLGQPVGMHYPR